MLLDISGWNSTLWQPICVSTQPREQPAYLGSPEKWSLKRCVWYVLFAPFVYWNFTGYTCQLGVHRQTVFRFRVWKHLWGGEASKANANNTREVFVSSSQFEAFGLMLWLQLRFDYDATTTYRVRPLPIRRKQKINMPVFLRIWVITATMTTMMITWWCFLYRLGVSAGRYRLIMFIPAKFERQLPRATAIALSLSSTLL